MKKQKTIFISAYRNVSIRYILYSDILKELRKFNLKMIIFVKDNDVNYYHEIFADDNVKIEPVYFKATMKTLRSFLCGLFVLTRKMISGSNQEFKNTTDNVRMYHYGYETKNILYLKFMLIKMLARMGNKSKFIRRLLVAIESSLYKGKIYDHYFDKYKPDLLIVSSTGYMIDPFFMRSAKRNGCKTLSIIHSWDNPSTKDYRGGDPDYVIAWNSIMKKELVVFHDIEVNKIEIGGIAHWDIYFKNDFKKKDKIQFCNDYGLDPNSQIIFYGTSGPKMFQNTFDTIVLILKAILSKRISNPVQLFVRLHPNYLAKTKNNGQLIDLYKKRIKVINKNFGDNIYFNLPKVNVLIDDYDLPIEDIKSLGEILQYSDILLTEYSSLMIEGAIFDKPVINVALHNFRNTDKPVSYVENFSHIKRILNTGATEQVYNEEMLFKSINKYLKNPKLKFANRRDLVKQEIYKNAGHAGEEIGRYITKQLLK